MAKKIYNYCMAKPYFRNMRMTERNDIYWAVKKTALIFALDEHENLNSVMAEVNAVTEMIYKGGD